ncbi:MAG: VWA domain-containing protein [Ardenticatenaceae bacterium]|nr:VWA domain-containing protein [Ardenticatenaceae bacterium]
MGLVAPLGLGLLALLAPIIAMYLLKRRREEVVVSSTYLWERVVQDIEANTPWQRLRRNLLLLLQVLFVLLLVLAAARPFLRTAGAAGRSLILIVDSSVSMAAIDGQGGSRLEAARREALRLTDGLPPDGRATVIRAGAGAEVLVAATRDRVAVEQALASIRPVAADSDLSAALNLAAAVAARQPESEIVLLSDGAVTAPTRVALEGRLRYVSVGQSGDNQAISALTLQPQGKGYALFVQVTNYAQAPASRRLTITAGEAPYAAFDLDLQPGQRAERVVGDLPATTTQVRASLGGQDLLAADDVAWAVPPPSGTRSVRLVTPGNIFLRAGLGLLPDVQLTVAAPPGSAGEGEQGEPLRPSRPHSPRPDHYRHSGPGPRGGRRAAADCAARAGGHTGCQCHGHHLPARAGACQRRRSPPALRRPLRRRGGAGATRSAASLGPAGDRRCQQRGAASLGG